MRSGRAPSVLLALLLAVGCDDDGAAPRATVSSLALEAATGAKQLGIFPPGGGAFSAQWLPSLYP